MAYQYDFYLAINKENEKKLVDLIEENVLEEPKEIFRDQGYSKEITVLYFDLYNYDERDILRVLNAEETIEYKALSLGEEDDDNEFYYNLTSENVYLDEFWFTINRKAEWANEKDDFIHTPKGRK